MKDWQERIETNILIRHYLGELTGYFREGGTSIPKGVMQDNLNRLNDLIRNMPSEPKYGGGDGE